MGETQEGVDPLEVVSSLPGVSFSALRRVAYMDLLGAISVVLPHVVYMDLLGIVSLVLRQGVCSIGITAQEIRY